jgi:uncharacterized membrane protein
MTHRSTHNLKNLIQVSSIASHWACVFVVGIMAGFFGTYSGNVNLAMLEMEGSTYALVQSAFNRNVRHPLFFVFFFGPVAIGLLALASAASHWRTAWWRLLAVMVLVYGLGIVIFTQQVNLPLNFLTESWTASSLPANWRVTRDAWNQANLWRSILSAILFFFAIMSLWMRAAARDKSK